MASILSRVQRFKACCCFGCCNGNNVTVGNALLIARATFGIIAAIHVLITFILLGAQMDAANFPGSNLILKEYQVDNSLNTITYDIDREGQYVQVLNGFMVEEPTGCSNRAVNASSSETSVTKTDVNLCKAATDNAADNQIKNWSDGWIVSPDCTRSNTNPSICAPFSSTGVLSWFGQLTFYTYSLQVILFCAHTCVAVYDQAKQGKSGSAYAVLRASSSQVKITLGLTITWCIIGVALFIASGGAWAAFCDKIDTGLGRRVQEGRACAGTLCVYPFSALFATITVAVIWFRIPYFLTWCGVLEAV